MIYVDSSVALAQLLYEERIPEPRFWHQALISSRLLVYEVWTRLHALGRGSSHSVETEMLLGRVALLELGPDILARALDPFPIPVRTLDALHLASLVFVSERQGPVSLASYDRRLLAAADAVGIPAFAP